LALAFRSAATTELTPNVGIHLINSGAFYGSFSAATSFAFTPWGNFNNDDWLVVVAKFAGDPGTVNTPAGWTKVADVGQGTGINHARMVVWVRRVVGGESGAQTFSWASASYGSSHLFGIRGLHTSQASAISVATAQGSTQTPTFGTPTNIQGRGYLAFLNAVGDTVAPSAVTWTGSGGFAEYGWTTMEAQNWTWNSDRSHVLRSCFTPERGGIGGTSAGTLTNSDNWVTVAIQLATPTVGMITRTATRPAGVVAGDLIVCYLVGTYDDNGTAPSMGESGWKVVAGGYGGDGNGGATAFDWRCFARVVTSSEPAGYSVNVNGNHQRLAVLVAYSAQASDVDTTATWPNNYNLISGSGSSSINIPSVTATREGAAMVGMVGTMNTTADLNTLVRTLSPPAALTERAEIATATPKFSMAVYDAGPTHLGAGVASGTHPVAVNSSVPRGVGVAILVTPPLGGIRDAWGVIPI